MKTRIEPLESPFAPEVEAILTGMMPPNVSPINLFKTLAKNPRVLQRIKNSSMLDKGSISLREREILIDRTTALCVSEYEWSVHIAFFAQKAQLNKEQIQSLTFGQSSDEVWTKAESLLIALVDELHQSSQVSDALWNELIAHFTEEQLIECVTLIGNYHTVSFINNAFQIELEKGVPRFEDYKN